MLGIEFVNGFFLEPVRFDRLNEPNKSSSK